MRTQKKQTNFRRANMFVELPMFCTVLTVAVLRQITGFSFWKQFFWNRNSFDFARREIIIVRLNVHSLMQFTVIWKNKWCKQFYSFCKCFIQVMADKEQNMAIMLSL